MMFSIHMHHSTLPYMIDPDPPMTGINRVNPVFTTCHCHEHMHRRILKLCEIHPHSLCKGRSPIESEKGAAEGQEGANDEHKAEPHAGRALQQEAGLPAHLEGPAHHPSIPCRPKMTPFAGWPVTRPVHCAMPGNAFPRAHLLH